MPFLLLLIIAFAIWFVMRQGHRSSSRRSHNSVRSGAGRNVRKKVLYYRTSDGTKTDYKFSFERQRNGSWRIYILEQPSYGSRSTGLHATHRLRDGDRKYICWDSRIGTLKEAKQVAALWSDKTQEYIQTGRRF